MEVVWAQQGVVPETWEACSEISIELELSESKQWREGYENTDEPDDAEDDDCHTFAYYGLVL